MISLNDVLLAMSNIPVDDPIAEIWGHELQGGYKNIEYTGSLPITINANGDVLIDYRIYGADGGVGEPTENLFNISRERSDIFTLDSKYYIYGGNAVNKNVSSSNIHIVVTDKLEVSSNSGSGAGFIIPVLPNTTYTLSYDIDLSLSDSTTSAVLNFIDNDERFGTYWGIYGNITKNTFTTESTTKYVYIIFRTVFRTVTYSNIILVEGLTPPPSYIPYGYKLPMTVYKQEFEVTSDMLDQSNWILSGYWFMYFDISDFISKAECDAKIYENFADGYTPQLLTVAITDKKYSMVDDSYRILKNNGEILDKKFDFSSWDKIYLCIGYGNGFSTEEDKQLKIDELFENWKILIAPTSQTREVPVYIGENKLDSVEGVADYVDKASGKIVRMIGEYTFTGDESFNKYGNSDVFYTSKTIDPVGITTVNTITMRCNHSAFTAIENKDTRYWLNPEADNICCFLPGGRSQVFLRSTSNFTTDAECEAYLKAQYDNGTPVKISYWLKTPVEEDPPVPLPEIPTIKGETIIDYDGTPKPSQMYVKYKDKG